MLQIFRLLLVVMITAMLVWFVTDFESVVEGFSALVDGISTLLSPIKAVFK